MISPFGGSAKRSATSRAGPRTTSSKCLVSSGHTATGRSGKAAARLAGSGAGAAGLQGDAGPGQRRSSSHCARGRKRPGEGSRRMVALAEEAAADERGFDRGRSRQDRTGTPRAMAAAMGLAPGSLTPGRPASLASATRRPPRFAAAPLPCERPRCARDGSRGAPWSPWRSRRLACGACPPGSLRPPRQLPEHAQRDVLEVADRRRADREGTRPGRRRLERDEACADHPGRGAQVGRVRPRNLSRSGLSARGTTPRAGAKSSSPAAAKPPPTTTSSGSKMLLASRAQSRGVGPISVRTRALGVVLGRARTSRSPRPPAPKARAASSSAAFPDTYDSRWPWPPQLPGRPSRTTMMCRARAGADGRGRAPPSEMIPPPTPVPESA